MKKSTLFLSALIICSPFLESAVYDYSVDITDFQDEKHHMGDIRIDISEQGALGADSKDAEVQLATNIRNQIKPAYYGYNISMHFVDGVLTLQGFVRTMEDKDSIEKDMLNVERVKEVENKLQVNGIRPS